MPAAQRQRNEHVTSGGSRGAESRSIGKITMTTKPQGRGDRKAKPNNKKDGSFIFSLTAKNEKKGYFRPSFKVDSIHDSLSSNSSDRRPARGRGRKPGPTVVKRSGRRVEHATVTEPPLWDTDFKREERRKQKQAERDRQAQLNEKARKRRTVQRIESPREAAVIFKFSKVFPPLRFTDAPILVVEPRRPRSPVVRFPPAGAK
eukprot:gnl/Chilomastix_cuspidata/1936.p1 GENE.gnl/Chilomastix_cuspidata/1936~~gnl/Chilomastix_cuspidata/1936.p1  ORF type:complete len:203 (+),score=49.82 gnl/Chilomastix_cuspidata/1936:48-656(+)